MNPSSSENETVVPWVCVLIALFVSAIAVGPFLTTSGGNLTALIRMAPGDPIVPIAQGIEKNFFFIPEGHYDGVYYYAIAIDPLATGEANHTLDLASHRYGHPAYGWLGWLASAGNPQWVPQALLLISLIGMAVGAYYTSLIALRLGLSAWAGLVIALNPGLIFSVTTDTSEAITAGFIAVALYLWMKDRRIVAGVLLAFLCFFKFQMILLPVALAGWELLLYLRGARDRDTKKIIALLAVGPILFCVWMVYLNHHFGELPISGGPEFLSLPFIGWFDTMGMLSNIHRLPGESVQIASAEIPILACLLVLIIIALVRSARLRHFLDAIFILQGLFLLLLNWWNLLYPKDLLRVIAVPLPLLMAAFFVNRAKTPAEQPLEGAPSG